MLLRVLGATASGLLCLTLMGMMPASPTEPQEPPPGKKKEFHGKKGEPGKEARKKADEGPEGDLNRAYNLLRRLRADGQSAGRTDPRLREWTERAVEYYRNGLKALREDNAQLAHEYGAIAHDLARAVEHTRNASLFDHADDDLPAPPPLRRHGRDGAVRKDLTKAYERIRDGDDGSDAGPKAAYYREAARDLYRAARRDYQAGRMERSGELSRAAEAMTHVCEHLGHAADVRETPKPRPGRGGPEADREGRILPPPLEP